MVNSSAHPIHQTTFSGSDITVIAYRNSENILSKFKVEGREKSEQTVQKEIDAAYIELQKKKKEIEKNEASMAGAVRLSNDIDVLSGMDIDKAAALGNQREGQWRADSDFQERQADLNADVEDLKTTMSYLQDATSGQKTEIQKNLFILGSLHTISYSSFREKFAVRSLGRSHATAYSRGPRTVAGTMVFQTIAEHELLQLLTRLSGQIHPDVATLDQIEPFNVLLLFANEYGQYSAMHLLNIDINSEGHELSVDQILSTNSLNFYATDMIPMRKVGSLFNNYDDMINGLITNARNENLTSADLQARRQNVASFVNSFSIEDEWGNSPMQNLVQQSRGLW